MKTIRVFAGLLLLLNVALPQAATIDFSSVDSTVPGIPYLVDRIGDVTFSHNLYPEHNDGFNIRPEGIAQNFYGESGEYISFDTPVFFESLDIGAITTANLATPLDMTILLLDAASQVLHTDFFIWSDAWSTHEYNVNNVARVVFNLTGTQDSYANDDRLHAWFGLDNIVYSEARADVALPGMLWLFAIGLLGLNLARRRGMAA